VRELFKASIVFVATYDSVAELLYTPYFYIEGEIKEFPPISYGEGISSIVIRTKKPLLLNKDAEVKAVQLHGVLRAGRPPKFWLGVPVLFEGEVLGVLSIQDFDRDSLFTPADVSLLETIAANLGVAMANARLNENVERRITRLSMLSEIGRALSSSLELDDVLKAVHEQIARSYDADNMFVALYNEGDSQWTGWYNIEGGVRREAFSLGIDEGFAGYVIRNRIPLLFRSTSEAEVFRAAKKLKSVGTPSKSLIAVPLVARDAIYGALMIQSYDRDGLFDEEDLELFTTIGHQLATSIRNSRLYRETSMRADEANAIAEVGRDVNESLEISVVLERAADWACRLLTRDTAAIFLTDSSGRTMKAVAAVGLSAGEIMRETIEIGRGIIGAVMERGVSEIVNDTYSDDRAMHIDGTPEDASNEKLLVVPIGTKFNTIGAIAVWRGPEEEEFSRDNLAFLEALARQVSIAFKNAKLYRDAKDGEKKLGLLLDLQRRVAGELDTDRVFRALCEKLRDAMEYDRFYAALLDEGELDFRCVWVKGEYRQGFKARLPDYPSFAECVRSAEPLLFDGLVPKDEEREGESSGSRMFAPIAYAGVVMGVVSIQTRACTVYDGSKLVLFAGIVAQTSTALRNADLYEQAKNARAEAEDANRIKTQFMANMSHELRTPLNSIINFAYLLQQGVEGELSGGQSDLLKRIEDSGHHLLELINNILDLAKIESGKLELFFEEVDVVDLLDGVMATAKGLLKDKPIELIKDVPAPVSPLRGDHTRLRQILLNLISNAVKFTEKGSIRVSIRDVPGYAEIRVADTGIGMRAEDVPKAFAEFVQIDGALNRKAGGTGLGLPISKKFVEMHGGQMRVESEVGKGSTFIFTIPSWTEIHEVERAEPVEPERKEERSAEVLVIDDDPVSADTIVRQLKSGFRVEKLNDPRAAFDAIREKKPKALVLDVMMPHKDGWELLRELKADPDTKDIPVVMCSVLHDRQLALSLQADEYLVKPFDRDEINAVMRRFAPEGGTVLAIDDDDNALEIVKRALGGTNYEAKVRHDPFAAISEAAESPPDVVILDLMMPGMNGFEFMERLRSNPVTAKVPVVVLTAMDLTEEDSERINVEAVRCLQKGSYTQDDLQRAIQRALAKRGGSGNG
jgi:signal transduction histidine kinase/CheY-like chemotaxis protein/putative methionine-R-sulfoxide reductase with GAF domain